MQKKREEILETKQEELFTEEYYFRILNQKRHILLYDEINCTSAELICSKLLAMNELNKTEPIVMEINSGGGSVTDGLAIIDTINRIQAPVHTIIIGEAASMAGLISISGKKRYITSNAVWMEHSTSDLVGDYLQHMRDRTNFLMKLETRMDNIMKIHTKLNNRQYMQIKNGELWLFSNEVIKYGVADILLK